MKLKKLLIIIMTIGLWGCSHNAKNSETSVSASANDVSSDKTVSDDYPQLEKDNMFYEGDPEALINFVQNGTGVVFFGDSKKENSQSYIVYLNDVLKENDLQAAVFDVSDLKKNHKLTGQLEDLLNKESDHQLVLNTEKDKNLLDGPLVVFLDHGKIITWDHETNDMDKVNDYWTDERVNALKTKLGNASSTIRKAQKDSQNTGCEKACTFGGD